MILHRALLPGPTYVQVKTPFQDPGMLLSCTSILSRKSDFPKSACFPKLARRASGFTNLIKYSQLNINTDIIRLMATASKIFDPHIFGPPLPTEVGFQIARLAFFNFNISHLLT